MLDEVEGQLKEREAHHAELSSGKAAEDLAETNRRQADRPTTPTAALRSPRRHPLRRQGASTPTRTSSRSSRTPRQKRRHSAGEHRRLGTRTSRQPALWPATNIMKPDAQRAQAADPAAAHPTRSADSAAAHSTFRSPRTSLRASRSPHYSGFGATNSQRESRAPGRPEGPREQRTTLVVIGSPKTRREWTSSRPFRLLEERGFKPKEVYSTFRRLSIVKVKCDDAMQTQRIIVDSREQAQQWKR